jgi:lysophospholipase L1-like esterase
MRSLVLTLAIGTLLAGCVLDGDGDGVVRWLFSGDSNTQWLPCSYPEQFQSRHDPAKILSYNEGLFGTTAHFWVDNDILVDALEADRPDAVVIALGTNDAGQHIDPADIAQDLLTLYTQAASFPLTAKARPKVFVATVPLIYDPLDLDPEGTELTNAIIDELNMLIRALFPLDHVVDFDSWMPEEWDATFMWTSVFTRQPDGVHLNCPAHEIRADLIDALLM